MYKRITLILLPFMIFLASAILSFAEVSFDTNSTGKGIVGVAYASGGKRVKVMIERGSSKYTYNLDPSGKTEYFPLQMGNGEYKISVLENVSGNKYSFVDTQKLQLNLADPNIVYLNSVQNVRWDSGYASIKNGKKLSEAEKNFGKKLRILYDHMVKGYKYDYDKISKLTPEYNPDVEATYREKKGICYDYSALLAAMQRSQGLPTKLVKGYASGVEGYHAWNEVLIDGQWVVVDTTFDSALWGGKGKYSMIKNNGDYKKVNEY